MRCYSRRLRLVCLLLLAVALLTPAAALAEPIDVIGRYDLRTVGDTFEPSGWWSSLYPRDWSAGWSDSRGRALQDFSYAGYHYGQDPLPSKEGSLTVDVTHPPFSSSLRGPKNTTKTIQRAIDYVGRKGGGVVYLPPGTYYIAPTVGASALTIRWDNVVLRGAGRDKTFLVNTSTRMNRKSVVLVTSTSPGRWWNTPSGAPNLAADAPAGARSVRVTNARDFRTGDLIVVRTEMTAARLAELGNPLRWTSRNADAATYLRRVTSVDTTAGTLAIDIPLRSPLLVRDAAPGLPNVYKARRHVREVGVEDLSIGMRAHPNNSSLAVDVHESSAIRFCNVIDGWVARVSTFAPKGNPIGVHLLSEGIWLDDSRNVTLVDCVVKNPQYGGGGNGDGYVVRSSDTLLLRCAAVRMRHAYTMSGWHVTGNVFQQSSSAGSYYASDFHAWYSRANLLEGMRLNGDWIDATYRPWGTGPTHGPTTEQSVIWNTVGLAPPAIRRYGFSGGIIDTVQWGWGAAIGTSGKVTRVVSDPVIDGVYGDKTRDIVEGVSRGRTLQPASLREDQLHRRSTGGGKPAHGFVLAPVLEESYAGTTLMPAGALAPVVGDRTWNLTFALSGGKRVTRARLVVYGRSRMDGGRIQTSVGTGGTSTYMAVGTPLSVVSRPAGATSSAWVFDVTDALRASQWYSLDARLALRLSAPYGNAAYFEPSGSDSAQLRPRLEVETATDPVVPVARALLNGRAITSATDRKRTTTASIAERGQLVLDLGSVRSVSGIGVAQELGDRRFGFLDIWASANGASWKPVRGVQGSGDTVDVEAFEFDAPVAARFIRLVGAGTSDVSTQVTVVRDVEVYGR